jgi:hypothetical protein
MPERTEAAVQRAPSNTLAFHSSQRERIMSMMKEFACLLSLLDRLATSDAHQIASVLCGVGGCTPS